MTIGELSRKFELSRSTLRYYDRIGLLPPSGSTAANYRIYTEKDVQRLEKICLYRKYRVKTFSQEILLYCLYLEGKAGKSFSSRDLDYFDNVTNVG